MRYEKTRAVVLSSRPLGEADRIVTLFSQSLGRVDAVVKGVRRTKSRWGGRLEPFGVVDLILYRGRSLHTVTSAQLVTVFPRLREDREAMTAAAVACEATAALFGEEEAHERVFNLLVRALKEADAGFDGPANETPLLLGVLMKLLLEAGYLPVLDHCVVCGEAGKLALGFLPSAAGLSAATACTRARRSAAGRWSGCAGRSSCRSPTCAAPPPPPKSPKPCATPRRSSATTPGLA